jgi:hypothetical protein
MVGEIEQTTKGFVEAQPVERGHELLEARGALQPLVRQVDVRKRAPVRREGLDVGERGDEARGRRSTRSGRCC